MPASPEFEQEVSFLLAFADIGPRWQCDGKRDFFFDRHLRYAESIPAALLGAAERIHMQAEAGKRPRFPVITCGLIDSAMFNCFARHHTPTDQYHAAMSVSVPVATLELASHYFSHPHFFPDIGDPSRGPLLQLDAIADPPMFHVLNAQLLARFSEKLDQNRAIQVHTSIQNAVRMATEARLREPRKLGTEQLRYFDTVIELMLPECPVRRMHCEYMSYALLHFLWIHEISHITNGHLIELRKRTGGSQANFDEFTLGQFATPNTEENSDCLAMEFDADIEAAVIMLGLIMSDIDIESDDAPYVPQLERVKLFTFALLAFYSSVAAREAASERLGTHPPALLRLENILIHLSGVVGHEGDLQNAIFSGYDLHRDFVAKARYRWAPEVIQVGGDMSIGKGKWWDIFRRRESISTGYNEHRLGNLRVFMTSIEDDLKSSPLWRLGPEPSWWT